MRKIFTIFLLYACCLGTTAQTPGRVRFDHLTIADGMSENSGQALLQDHLGYIWIATQNGLCRYDGNKMVSYQYSATDPYAMKEQFLTALAEDQNGDIWIGGENNLHRLERATQRFYEYPIIIDGKKGTTGVRYIHVDKTGSIWVLLTRHNSTLSRFEPKTNTWTHFSKEGKNNTSLTDGNVFYDNNDYGLTEDKSGNLWVTTVSDSLNTLHLFDRKANKFVPYKAKVDTSLARAFKKVNGITADHNGNLYLAATSSHSLFFLNTSTTEVKRLKYSPPSKTNPVGDWPLTPYEDKMGYIWVSNIRGLDRYDPATNSFKHYDIPITDSSTHGNGYYRRPVESSEGNIWFRDFRAVICYDRKADTFIRCESNRDKNDGFVTPNFLESTIVDRSGLLWIGVLNGGVFKQSRENKMNSIANEFTNDGRQKEINVSAIYEAPSEPGIIWLGTTDGLKRYDKKNGRHTYYRNDIKNKNSIGAIWVNTIAEDKQGRFWVGSYSGLELMDRKTGKFEHFHHDTTNANSLVSDDVNMIKPVSDGTLWIATNYGISHFDPATKTFTNYSIADSTLGFKDNVFYTITEDSKKNIWLGTNRGGVVKFDPVRKTFVTFFDFLKGPVCIPAGIIEDKKSGNYWLGDYIAGLLLINEKGEILKQYNASNGLTGNSVLGMVMDESGILWLSTQNGIYRFDPETERFRYYNQRHGLAGLDFNSMAFFREQDGQLLFGGKKGVNAFYPADFKTDTIVPEVAFTNLDIAGKPATLGKDGQLPVHISAAKEISLPYHDNDLTIHFTSLLFNRGNETSFAYKLSPNDKDWVQAGNIRQVRYTDLSPGRYTFTVKASNADGVWNEKGVSVEIIIRSPWWKTWWAYMLYVLAIIGVIVFYIRYRSASLQKENKLLEEKVELRTGELKASMENLKATQSQLVQSEKMASLGELTAGIAHEIQNPLNFVNNFSEINKELAEELKAELATGNIQLANEIVNDISENSEKINHHGKRADAIVKGMLQHSRSGGGQKEPTDINALTDEYLRLSYHGLRAKDKSFNAAFHTDFDAAIGNINIVPQDIGRVIMNLLTNAFYAVNEKRTKQPEGYEPTVSVKTKKEGSKILISVTDNGNGIPASVIDKIFQPFFTTKPTGQGTGLGLSMSYDIIKAHGGELKVTNRSADSGGGAFFIIELPA